MLFYKKRILHDITDLNDEEISMVMAGLLLLANGAKNPEGTSFLEYQADAGKLLDKIDPTIRHDFPA